MPSASSTFSIGAGSTVTDIFNIGVIPGVGDQAWPTGRLTHPTLGAYDYLYAPAGWSGYLLEVFEQPLWSVETTMVGAAHTLWPPLLPDTIVSEFWTGLPIAQLRPLLAMMMNPPNPADDQYITWSPNYATDASYKIIMMDFRAGNLQGANPSVVFDGVAYYVQGGWTTESVELMYRIVDSV